MIMNRDKVLELAREAELARQFALEVPFVVDRLQRFAALIEREVRGGAEPVAFEFQHEDTGLIDFVDPQQVEWGFQKNNPRWQLIGPVFRHPAPAVVRQLVDAIEPLAHLDLKAGQLEKYDDDLTVYQRDNTKITIGDIRRAQAALAAAKEAGL